MTDIPVPDFTILARRPSERLIIVEHILGTPGLQETDYLEWKTAYDLETKPGAAATARQLIGMANRDRAQAMRHVEGYGYVLLGVEPGNLTGVPQWDSAKIENSLSRYVDSKLRYDVHYVEKDERNVLFITIDPPRQGDHIYCLRASSQEDGRSLREGTIYVRRSGLTEPANSADIDRLGARSAPVRDGAAVIRDLGIEFDTSGISTINPMLLSDEFRDNHLDIWRGKMLALAPRPKAINPHMLTVGLDSSVFDSRSYAEYVAEVELHVQSVKATPGLWRRMVMCGAIEEGKSKLVSLIKNESEEHYANAVVEITLIGLGRANVHPDASGANSILGLTNQPQGWGNLSSPPIITPSLARERVIGPEVESLGEGEILIRYSPLGVRPHTPHRLQPLLLALLPHFAGQRIAAHWRVTASNTKSDLHGDIELHLSPDNKSAGSE